MYLLLDDEESCAPWPALVHHAQQLSQCLRVGIVEGRQIVLNRGEAVNDAQMHTSPAEGMARRNLLSLCPDR